MNRQVKDMYGQRDSLQIELEKIENEKRLNAERYQMEQKRIKENLKLELERINNQTNYRYVQNTLSQTYSTSSSLPLLQPQIVQNRTPQIPDMSFHNLPHQQRQNNINSDDMRDFIKLIYDHAKQALEQLSAKEFLTPEEQHCYSELKDAIDFMEAGHTLRNQNKSFISKVDAAQKVDSILRKYFPQIIVGLNQLLLK